MRTDRRLLNALAGALIAGLGACGGGGGDGAPASTALIDITAANGDNVGHATAAAILTLSPTGAILSLTTSGSAPRRLVSAWLRRLKQSPASAVPHRESAQAILGPYVNACAVSGSTTETDDDRDGNGVPSVGDVVTMVYNNCQDKVGETVDGSMTLTITAINTGAVPSGDESVTLSHMSIVTAKHSLTTDGSMTLHYVPATGTSLETARMTATSPVTVTVSTHVGYSDTVTLQNGFYEEDAYDASLLRTSTTLSGRVQSTAAGGQVQVASVAGSPIVKYDADDYPSSGAVQVSGRNSSLLITASSATAVRLDLDADGNGSFESTETVAWDWLL